VSINPQELVSELLVLQTLQQQSGQIKESRNGLKGCVEIKCGDYNTLK
jgi:hypothetical protein